MQAYDAAFARIYNLRWIGFAQRVAPAIQAAYERTPLGASNRSMLDLCCGTGQLAVFFAERGYNVVGLDLSPHMLEHAQRNAAPYVAQGRVRFVQGDAARFDLPERFGLIVSTFDALNHLPGEEALRSCFEAAYAAILPGGTLIFDLNTAGGLKRWQGISVQEDEEATLIHRGLVDEEGRRAWTRITGFTRMENGLYERFALTAYNTMFDLAWVRQALLGAGWIGVRFCKEDLGDPVPEPESERRVFVIAHKDVA